MTNTLALDREAAAREWARRVQANREQVERFREAEDGPDFYGPIAAAFRDNPHRTDDPILNALLELVEPDETWLDIGAGGGRYGLPIALKAERLIAVDPSDGMLGILRETAEEHGIDNVDIVQGRWPLANPPVADGALMAGIGMDIEDIGSFVDAAEASVRRLCVAVMPSRPPTAVFDAVWPAVHGEQRATLPTLPELLALLLSRGTLFNVTLVERGHARYRTRDDLATFLRRQTWVAEGSAKDQVLLEQIDRLATERDGQWALSWEPVTVGVVSWTPGQDERNTGT